MNMRPTMLAAAALLLSGAPLWSAQFPTAAGTVSATGIEVIKHPAELLRMRIEIAAQGKTLPDALKKLAARREAALATLKKMANIDEHFVVGDVKLDATKSDRQRQMEMMVRQRMAQGGKKKKQSTESPVTVSCSLTCQWTLKGKTPEQQLVEAQAIQHEVRDADLAGAKSEEKTAEERELAEEMEEGMNVYNDDSEGKPGEPMFLYVTKISTQEREKALAAAFAKARKQAEELCEAAGGALEGLDSLSQGNYSNAYGYRAFNRFDRVQNQALRQWADEQSDPEEGVAYEALGVQPSEVARAVSITASFKLKSEK